MNRRRLYRCNHDRRLAGVAGGLAEYLDLDPTIVRIVWVLSIFFGGITILAYIAMALIVPLEPEWSPAMGPAGPRGFTGPVGPAGTTPWFAGTTGPGAAEPAPTTGADGEPAGDATGAAPAGPAPAAGWGEPGSWWIHGQAPSPGWQPAEPHQHRERRGLGLGAPFAGMLLILFGALALADEALPGWAGNGHLLWPGFILGVGVLLVVAAVRRQPTER